ncbi:hypothetical protein [Croceimicrobium sp.]|uniref:hypothetical protein n=1 Tax=Croceimicrobium sp. TaxID=2828340 RepID=UPI003BAA188E
MRKLIISALSLSLLWACNSGEAQYAEEIAHVDSMLAINDSLQKSFDQVDSTQILQDFPKVDSLYKILSGPMADQQDKRYWTETMANIDVVHHPYMKYSGDYKKMRRGLAYSKSQLESLRNSLEDQKLDTAQVRDYIQAEEKALNDMQVLIGKRIMPVLEAKAIWDTAEARYLDLVSKSDSLAQ